MGGHYYDVQVTDMYTLSDDPNDPHSSGTVLEGFTHRRRSVRTDRHQQQARTADQQQGHSVWVPPLPQQCHTQRQWLGYQRRLCTTSHAPGPVLCECIIHGQSRSVVGQCRAIHTERRTASIRPRQHQLHRGGRKQSHLPVRQRPLSLHLQKSAHTQSAGRGRHAYQGR